MNPDIEVRYSPIGIEGRTLTGTVMKYGEVSTGAPRPEKFLPGAFKVPPDGVILNVQHDRNKPIARTPDTLILTDTAEALELRAEVPGTQEGSDTIVLVRNRILTGLSVEFQAVKEHFEAGVRVIAEAVLSGVSVVDRAAYSGSKVEARRMRGVSMSFKIPYGKKMRCECCTKAPNVRFRKGAFDDVVNEKSEGDTLAVVGNYRGALSSKRRGTLRPKNTKDALVVESDLADIQPARDLIAQADDVPILARPIVDFDKSKFTVVGDVAEIEKAHVRGFILGPSDASAGWEPVRIIREAEENRRVHTWL